MAQLKFAQSAIYPTTPKKCHCGSSTDDVLKNCAIYLAQTRDHVLRFLLGKEGNGKGKKKKRKGQQCNEQMVQLRGPGMPCCIISWGVGARCLVASRRCQCRDQQDSKASSRERTGKRTRNIFCRKCLMGLCHLFFFLFACPFPSPFPSPFLSLGLAQLSCWFRQQQWKDMHSHPSKRVLRQLLPHRFSLRSMDE